MKIIEARNARWIDAQNSIIECEVRFDSEPDQWSPIGLAASDPYEHIQETFAAVVRGQFGAISSYVPHSNPTEPAFIQTASVLEFFDRFTEEEQLAIVAATMSDPQIKLWYDKLLAASFVDFNDQRLQAGLQAMVAKGLIAESRRLEILPQSGIPVTEV